jgi:hypothetical protein
MTTPTCGRGLSTAGVSRFCGLLGWRGRNNPGRDNGGTDPPGWGLGWNLSGSCRVVESSGAGTAGCRGLGGASWIGARYSESVRGSNASGKWRVFACSRSFVATWCPSPPRRKMTASPAGMTHSPFRSQRARRRGTYCAAATLRSTSRRLQAGRRSEASCPRRDPSGQQHSTIQKKVHHTSKRRAPGVRWRERRCGVMADLACDPYKPDKRARIEDDDSYHARETRIAHERGALRQLLAGGKPGSPVTGPARRSSRAAGIE